MSPECPNEMIQSEMSVLEVVKDCASFGGADGSDLLHLCFDDRTEYDTYVFVVFDKNAIVFDKNCSKCCFFYETCLHSTSVDKKKLVASIKQIFV